MRSLPVVFAATFQTPEGGTTATDARDGLPSADATAAGCCNSSSRDTLQQRHSLETSSIGVGLQDEHGVSESDLKLRRFSTDIEQDGVFRSKVVLLGPSASEQRVAEVVKVAARERKMKRSRRSR